MILSSLTYQVLITSAQIKRLENFQTGLSGLWKMFFSRKIEIQFSLQLSVDLFASKLNRKIEKYCSWKCYLSAWQIDAFTLDWGSELFYAFPPFCLMRKCVQKKKHEKATGLIVAPIWPTDLWFTHLL